MKNFVYILLLYPFLLLIGCDNLSEKLCKLDGDKLMFYSSDDSLIFYRKK